MFSKDTVTAVIQFDSVSELNERMAELFEIQSDVIRIYVNGSFYKEIPGYLPATIGRARGNAKALV